MPEANVKQLASLKYQFLFNPTNTFQNGYQFEQSFGNFLEGMGMRARIISPQGNTSDRMIWIEPIEQITPNVKLQKQITPKEAMQKIKEKVK